MLTAVCDFEFHQNDRSEIIIIPLYVDIIANSVNDV